MNKKIIILGFSLIVFSFWVGTVSAKTYYYDSINVDIRINQDSTFDVVEKQVYNLNGSFGYFYRDIELKNLDHISDIEIFDSKNKELTKEEYKISYKSNNLTIQWNFPRRNFDNELKSWTIKYKVHGGLGFYNNYDELYWNAIFADRSVEVKKAEILVYLPKEFKPEEIEQKLFVGKLGSENQFNNYEIIDNQTIKFWEYNIQPQNFLTIALAWPKGVVKKPLLYRNQIINWIVLLMAISLPMGTFIRMYIVWRKKGKDPKIEKSIMAEYSPPDDFPPAIFGALIDQSVDIKEIIATIIDLAVRGYLRIIEKEKKIVFIKTKEYVFEKLKDESNLKPFEQKIMKSIFDSKKIVSSNSLQNEFYKNIPEIEKLLYEEIQKTGYFDENIQRTREKYFGFSIKTFIALILFGFWALFMAYLGYFFQVVLLGLSSVVSAVIALIFAHYMPRMTPKGLEAKWKLIGFKDYLHTAERFRLGAETVDTFSKYLPYAMILSVEKEWAKRFADIEYKEQNWYVPAVYVQGKGGGGATSFSSFSSNFSSFTSSISSSLGVSGSGAGGVGGGGAGGGGGGGGGGAG